MSADFLIVGGGIGGVVLAELLGRGGKKVVLLEKNAGPPSYVRPEILWPATVEVLCSLIPRGTWEKDSVISLRGIDLIKGPKTLPLISSHLFNEIGIRPWFTNPNQTREHLLKLSAFELRRGMEVTSILKKENRIVGVRALDVSTGKESEWLAQWVVGDDGPQSVVRKACGFNLDRTMLPFDFHCFGFEWPEKFTANTARVWLNPEASQSGIVLLAAGPLPNGQGIGFVGARPSISDSTQNFDESWVKFCNSDPAIRDVVRDRRFPNDFVSIRRGWGHVTRYGTDGAVLLGDAAHPVTPAGGQGANMSVADACLLARLALAGEKNLVVGYERQRRPANERSIQFSKWASRLWSLPEWAGPTSLFQSLVWCSGRYPVIMRQAVKSAARAFRTDPM